MIGFAYGSSQPEHPSSPPDQRSAPQTPSRTALQRFYRLVARALGMLNRQMRLDPPSPLDDTVDMKYARISFPSRDVAVRAFHELAQRGRIVSLPDGQFIVPEAATAFLQTCGLIYQTHEWMSEDYVTQALRNPAPNAV